MKLAILGGTFNPIHNGHLMLAEDVRKEFGYDKVLFIPAFIPPHKKYTALVSDEQRIEMIKLAIAQNENFAIDTCEIDRKGVSYTIDTINDLEVRYAKTLEDKIGLIIGDDLLKDFGTWHLANQLISKVNLIVGKRLTSNSSITSEFKFSQLENSILPISSSDIRQRIIAKKSWRYLVPESVFTYINNGRLYE